MFSAEHVAARLSHSASPLRVAGGQGHRRRKLSTPTRNQAAQWTILQTKLSVNQPGDRFEQEADRVADAVVRMPESPLGAPPLIQRMCAECEEEVHRKEQVSGRPSVSGIQLPQGGGRPLPESVRAFYEPRFSHKFDHVRVHTGGQADASARSLNALAYTFGSNIAFAAGHYSADTDQGRRLLAHELTHVIQQGSTHARHTIQRSCKAGVAKTTGCVPDPSISPPATRFLFNVNCDDFAPGLPPFVSEEGRMDAFARALSPTATVNIVGLASFDGAPDLNERLACSRAQRGSVVIRRSAPSGVTISSVDALVGGPATASDPNMRAVGVNVSMPPPPPPPVIKPGPRTPCERTCDLNFDRCIRLSSSPLGCLAARTACLGGCVGAPSAFEVCARLLQPPVEVSGCNHAYVETPTRRYAIITPCTGKLSFATPGGGVAIKTNMSPDPCGRPPTCIDCVPKPGITDLEKCFDAQFAAYAAPSVHKLLGPNSNTFAGTLARACCDNMSPKPAAFGCLPGWDDPPAPSARGPCPSGPPVC